MNKLAIDITSVPREIDLSNLIEWYQTTGLMFWDSSLGGKAPEILEADENCTIHIIDLYKEPHYKDLIKGDEL